MGYSVMVVEVKVPEAIKSWDEAAEQEWTLAGLSGCNMSRWAFDSLLYGGFAAECLDFGATFFPPENMVEMYKEWWAERNVDGCVPAENGWFELTQEEFEDTVDTLQSVLDGQMRGNYYTFFIG